MARDRTIIFDSAPDAVFAALIRSLPAVEARLEGIDDFGTSCRFTTETSIFEYSGVVRASVRPIDQGAVLTITRDRPDRCDSDKLVALIRDALAHAWF